MAGLEAAFSSYSDPEKRALIKKVGVDIAYE